MPRHTGPRHIPIALAFAAIMVPTWAAACPVCFNMREASRLAFVWTAVLMSLLPLAMIGGVIFWVWRQSRRNAEGGAGGVGGADPVSGGAGEPL